MTAPDQRPHRMLGAGATVAALSQGAVALGLGLTGVVVARTLGAGGTGAFNVALTAVALLTLLAGLGVELGVNYHVSGGRWNAPTALRQAQLAALVLGVLGFGLGMLAVLLLRDSAFKGVPAGDMAIALAGLPFALSWLFSSFAALGVNRYEAFGAAPASEALLLLPLAAALTIPFGLTGAVLALTLSHVLAAGGMLVWARRRLGVPERAWVRGAVGRLRAASRFGVPAELANVLQFLNYRADLLLLNAFAPAAKVGQYAVALTVTTAGQLLPRALASVVLPRVSALDARQPEGEELKMVLTKSVRHGVLISLGTGLLLAGGLFLVPAVYGPEFGASVGLGLILVPGVACAGAAGVLASVTTGKGFPQYSLRTVAMVTPPTLLLYVLLVPRYEAVGAAVASSISYAAGTGVTWHYFRRATGCRRLSLLVPGREELADYRLLASRIRTRLRA